MSVYLSRGTLVPQTCARAVVAPYGKARPGSAKRRPSIQDKAPGKRSLPGQGDKAPGKRSLPGQGGKAPARGACRDERARMRPFKNKVYKTEDRDPDKRSLSGRPNPGTTREARHGRHAPRQGLIAGELSGAGRQPPRQATCRGKSPPQDCAPAHPPTRRSGVSPKGTWRGTAQPGVCGGMQPPPWRAVAHPTVRLGAVQATVTGI